MTDPVIGAVTGAAAAAGKHVLEEQRKTNALHNEALLKKAIESPGFARAAELRGERLARREAVIYGLLSPLTRFSAVVAERFAPEILPELASRLDKIPQEDLQSPKATVGVPALNGLALSMDEPDLKRLYIELLATASDSKVAPSAHPSFVDIIRQLTSDEADLLGSILRAKAVPTVRLDRVETETKGFITVVNHLVPFVDDSGEELVPPFATTFVDNWVRLGLVNVNYTQRLEAPSHYDWVEERSEVQLARTMYIDETHTVEVTQGLIEATSFGNQFALAVGITKV